MSNYRLVFFDHQSLCLLILFVAKNPLLPELLQSIHSGAIILLMLHLIFGESHLSFLL